MAAGLASNGGAEVCWFTGARVPLDDVLWAGSATGREIHLDAVRDLALQLHTEGHTSWASVITADLESTMANLGLGTTEDMLMDDFLAAMARYAAGEGDPVERAVLKAVKQSVKLMGGV